MPTIDLGSVVGPQGPQGATGATGATGAQGTPGPNFVSTTTNTDLNGVLSGNGSRVVTVTTDGTPDSSHTSNLITSAAVANGCLYFQNQTVNPGTGEVICTVSDSRITANHVVVNVTVGHPANLKSYLSWTTSAGGVTFTGTCTSATTLSFILVRKGN